MESIAEKSFKEAGLSLNSLMNFIQIGNIGLPDI